MCKHPSPISKTKEKPSTHMRTTGDLPPIYTALQPTQSAKRMTYVYVHTQYTPLIGKAISLRARTQSISLIRSLSLSLHLLACPESVS